MGCPLDQGTNTYYMCSGCCGISPVSRHLLPAKDLNYDHVQMCFPLQESHSNQGHAPSLGQ